MKPRSQSTIAPISTRAAALSQTITPMYATFQITGSVRARHMMSGSRPLPAVPPKLVVSIDSTCCTNA